MTDSTYERELELDEAFQNLSLEDIDGKNDNSRIKELETRLYKLHDYLRSTEKAHYQKIREMKEDILSLRSSGASSDVESVNLSRIIDANINSVLPTLETNSHCRFHAPPPRPRSHCPREATC